MKEPLLRAMEEMGITPHEHNFGETEDSYTPSPHWLFRHLRYTVRRCCGVRKRRMTKMYTQQCEVCGVRETWFRGQYGLCDVCGGITDEGEMW